MAVVMAREAWTDERLDDLNKKVDDGFKEMREEFRALRGEVTGEFQTVRGEIKTEFQAVRGEIQGVRDEVAAMNRNLIQMTWGLIGMMLVGFLGIVATILTQT
jgi:uncharacterized protein (DUF3084 family)